MKLLQGEIVSDIEPRFMDRSSSFGMDPDVENLLLRQNHLSLQASTRTAIQ